MAAITAVIPAIHRPIVEVELLHIRNTPIDKTTNDMTRSVNGELPEVVDPESTPKRPISPGQAMMEPLNVPSMMNIRLHT